MEWKMKENNQLLNNLKLIKYLDEICIEELEYAYKICLRNESEDYVSLVAFIDKKTGEVDYCVANIYNNSSDCESIDIEALNKLQSIVKALIGN